ncbi:hypothetical protein D3C86_1676290 [compost metagenome]
MVLAFIAITHFPQADLSGDGLQLAVAVGRAGQAVQRVIGDVQLHDVAAQGRELWRLGMHGHAFSDRRGAGRGVAAHAVDLHQAHAAGAKGFQAVGGTEFGNGGAQQRSGAHHRSAFGHADAAAVDVQGDLHLAVAGRRAQIDIGFRVEESDHCSASEACRPKSAGKCLRALATG